MAGVGQRTGALSTLLKEKGELSRGLLRETERRGWMVTGSDAVGGVLQAVGITEELSKKEGQDAT